MKTLRMHFGKVQVITLYDVNKRNRDKKKKIEDFLNEMERVVKQAEGFKDPSNLTDMYPEEKYNFKIRRRQKEVKKYAPAKKEKLKDVGYCQLNRLQLTIANAKKIKKQKKAADTKEITFNALLKSFVSGALGYKNDYYELCRLIFGIPFEHGEGYTYQNELLAKMNNEYVRDFYIGMRVIKKYNVPKKFVEYKQTYDGYYAPTLPKKCHKCSFLEINEVFTGKLSAYGTPLIAPRFKCNCNDLFDAPKYDCMPDIRGEYVVPEENIHILATKKTPLKSTWVQKLTHRSYKESSGIDEDLEIIAPGDRNAKIELMKTCSSIEICFIAFQLKMLEPKPQPETETYSEYFMSAEEIEYEDMVYQEDSETVELKTDAIQEDIEESATYDIHGSMGVNQFTYVHPHFRGNAIKIRGLFNQCATVQDLIDLAKSIDWSIVNWEEYHTKKNLFIETAKDRMKAMIAWIKANPAEGKKRLVDITYRGVKPNVPVNSDELHILWQAVMGNI